MTASANPHDYPPTRWIAMVVLLIASFMNMVDVTIVNVSLPSLQTSFGASSSAIEWVVAAYTLSFALALLPFGRLGDTFGRTRMFIVGVAAFTFCSLLCGLATNIETLIIARILQGFASAMVAPQTLAIAQVIFPPKERGAAFALFGLTASLAAVSGPIAGGLLIGADIADLGWRPIFLVNIPIGILAILAAIRYIPAMPGNRSVGTDPMGIALAAMAIFLLVFPLIEGRGYGWPFWCFAMMAASAPFAFGFVLWQRHRAGLDLPQLVPATLFANRNFVIGSLLSMVFFSCVPGFFLVFAVFLQNGFGLTPLQSGMTTVPFSVGILLSSILSGKLGTRSPRLRILTGSLVMALSMLWLRAMLSGVGTEVGRLELAMPLFFAGIGMGTAIAPMFQAILANVGGRDAGSASGSLQSFQQVGGGLGVAIMGEIFFSSLGRGMALAAGNPQPVFIDSLRAAIVYIIVALLGVAAFAYALSRPANVHTKTPQPVAAAD